MIKRALSGITPSGSNLHIGNYFGAVKQQIELQNSIDQTLYFVADLHALTTVHDKEQLQNNIRNVVLDYLALGVARIAITLSPKSQNMGMPSPPMQ